MSDEQLGKLALASSYGAGLCFAGALALQASTALGLIFLGTWLIFTARYLVSDDD